MKIFSTRIIGAVSTAAVFAILTVSSVRAQDERRDNPPAQQDAKPAPAAHPADRHETKPAQDSKPDRKEDARPAQQSRPPEQDRHTQQEQQKQAQDQARHAQQDQQKQVQQQEKNQQKQAEQQGKDQERQAKQNQRDQGRQDQDRRNQDQRTQNMSRPAPSEQHPSTRAQNSPPPRPGNGPRGGDRIPDDRFRAHFGREHHFRVSHPTIIEGRPRFQYSGYWFEFVDPWPANWSYDDDCYIDYVDDGYWLYDPRYPGMRIAVLVVF
jgi:hypothetical protein